MNTLWWIVFAPTAVAAGCAMTGLLPVRRPVAQHHPTPRPHVRDELLERARRAIRSGALDLAEALVMEYGQPALSDAACMNVLGVVAELRGRWADARKLWGKALRADRRYEPARENLRRYFELWTWGRSECRRALGDETTLDLLCARSIRRGQ